MKLKTIVFFFVLCSCSEMAKKNNIYIEYASVNDMRKFSEKPLPSIRNGFNHNESFGPSVGTGSSLNIKKAEQSPNVIGLFLGPCLYRSINYIDLLKLFEEHSIPIHVLSGVGIGAIVASLFAKGETPELIEWKFYKLYSKLSNEKAYSSNWLKILSAFLEKEFHTLKIENLKKTLVLPMYSSKTRRVEFLKRGKLYDILFRNFILSPVGNYKNATSPLVVNFNKHVSLYSNGVDKLFIANILGDKIIFKKPSDFIFGIYSKLSGFLNLKSENKNIFYINIPNGEVALDSSRVFKESKKYLYNHINELKKFSVSNKNKPVALGNEDE